MQTIGKLLKKRRLQLKLDLETVEADLRIRKKYLRALEENDFDRLPGESYTRGFVQNYSKYLGLDEEKVLAFFRRQYTKQGKREVVPGGAVNPLNKTWFRITPQRAAVIAAVLVAGGVFLFLFLQYRNLQKKDTLDRNEEISHTVEYD